MQFQYFKVIDISKINKIMVQVKKIKSKDVTWPQADIAAYFDVPQQVEAEFSPDP